jgi:hypothetical protein
MELMIGWQFALAMAPGYQTLMRLSVTTEQQSFQVRYLQPKKHSLSFLLTFTFTFTLILQILLMLVEIILIILFTSSLVL